MHFCIVIAYLLLSPSKVDTLHNFTRARCISDSPLYHHMHTPFLCNLANDQS